MKFHIERDVLLETLQRAQTVIERKSTLPILSYFLLQFENQELTVTATDLTAGVILKTTVSHSQESTPGKVALSGRSLVEIVKELPSKPVYFERKDNHWIEISCHRSQFNLAGLGSEEFPPIPSFHGAAFFSMNGSLLKEMIDRTLFAASTDETRYQMNGVFMEPRPHSFLRLVATDGHRLALSEKEVTLSMDSAFQQFNKGASKGIIVPRKGLLELKRMSDGKNELFEMSIQQNNLLARQGPLSLFVRLIDGDFPPYETVLPKGPFKRVTMSRTEFLSALKRVNLFSHEMSRVVKFEFSQNLVTLSSSHPDLGEAREELEVVYEGDPIEIGFNAHYIIDCLGTLDASEIIFDITDKLSPGLLKMKDREDFTYIVMPMRI